MLFWRSLIHTADSYLKVSNLRSSDPNGTRLRGSPCGPLRAAHRRELTSRCEEDQQKDAGQFPEEIHRYINAGKMTPQMKDGGDGLRGPHRDTTDASTA